MQIHKWAAPIVLLSAAAFTAGISTRVLAQEPGSQPVVKKAATAKFAGTPTSPPCVTSAVERGVPGQGPDMVLVRFSPGCAFPWHWHTANEELLIVSGTFTYEPKGGSPTVLRPGDYVFTPAHHVHHGTCAGRTPCIFFVSRDGAVDYHFVNAAGQEISLAEALKSSAKKGANPPKQ